jgi:aminoglycoside N3'-acetyltransferase
VPVDAVELARQLRMLGLPSRQPLMVHASLRRLGPVEGGARAVVAALLDVLGPHGTLVMPLGGSDELPFDAESTPAEAEIGTLAEVFRRDPRTAVNDHPAGRFGAIGPQAGWLLEPTPADDYLGPGSLLERFEAAGGQVLRLGADDNTVTLTHLAEYRAALPAKRRVRRGYRRADGRLQWVESLDDCEGIVDWPPADGAVARDGAGPTPVADDYFAALLQDFLASGQARCGSVGNCRAQWFDAAAYVRFATSWMERHLHAASLALQAASPPPVDR